jgi:hypothetical protein
MQEDELENLEDIFVRRLERARERGDLAVLAENSLKLRQLSRRLQRRIVELAELHARVRRLLKRHV